MTTDKQLKAAAHALVASELAAGRRISYQAALYRLDPARGDRQAGAPGIFSAKLAGFTSALSWTKLNEYLDETEAHLKDDDVYRQAAAFQQRAFLYNELAAHTTEPTYKAACYRAAICDETSAARIRFEHGIPNIKPKTEAHLLGLRTCDSCGRPWQLSEDGACPDCPRMRFGPPPSSAAEAGKRAQKQPAPAPYITDEQSAAAAERYNDRDIPGQTWASDDDGEARYEQQAADDLPPAPCPDCNCCDQFACYVECHGMSSSSCPCARRATGSLGAAARRLFAAQPQPGRPDPYGREHPEDPIPAAIVAEAWKIHDQQGCECHSPGCPRFAKAILGLRRPARPTPDPHSRDDAYADEEDRRRRDRRERDDQPDEPEKLVMRDTCCDPGPYCDDLPGCVLQGSDPLEIGEDRE